MPYWAELVGMTQRWNQSGFIHVAGPWELEHVPLYWLKAIAAYESATADR